MFPVLNFIPSREISRLRKQPSPIVAWHALDDESVSFSFLLVLVLVLSLLLAQLLWPYTPSFPPTLTPWLQSILKDPLGFKKRTARLAQLDDRYRIAAEKFAKMAHRYRNLQAQLKVRRRKTTAQLLS
jgi:hypothetical protein